jgi:hypothetical protein
MSGGIGYRSRFYLEAFRASLGQFLFDVRESTGRQIELECQLNGLAEDVTLAGYLAREKDVPTLDDQHPFFVQTSPRYRPG